MKVTITEARPGYPYRVGQIVDLRRDAALHLITRHMAVEGEVAGVEPDEAEVQRDLSTLKVDELRELADQRGIDHATLKKAELVAAIEAHDAAQSDSHDASGQAGADDC